MAFLVHFDPISIMILASLTFGYISTKNLTFDTMFDQSRICG